MSPWLVAAVCKHALSVVASDLPALLQTSDDAAPYLESIRSACDAAMRTTLSAMETSNAHRTYFEHGQQAMRAYHYGFGSRAEGTDLFVRSIVGGMMEGGVHTLLAAAQATQRLFPDCSTAQKLKIWRTANRDIKALARMPIDSFLLFRDALIDEEGSCFRPDTDPENPGVHIAPGEYVRAEMATNVSLTMRKGDTLGCPALQLGVLEQLQDALEASVVASIFGGGPSAEL